MNLTVAQITELSEVSSIVGIKEASDSLERLSELIGIGEDMPVYTGNDANTALTMALGGYGVISVASNVIPKTMAEITKLCKECKYKLANERQNELSPFIKALFADTNPAPIKYILSELGEISNEIRLPLSMPKEAQRRMIMEAYERVMES